MAKRGNNRHPEVVRRRTGGRSPAGRQTANRPPLKDFTPELDLHGFNVSDMLPVLDDFLHHSFRSGQYRVRIVHGKGTGVLKLEVGRYLDSHPLVSSHRPASLYNGGSGAMEVELSDR